MPRSDTRNLATIYDHDVWHSDAPLIEPLEPRLMLTGTSEQLAIELFSVSPALFVENAGQWDDPAIRYVHNGSGASVAMTDDGILFQVTRRDLIDGADDGLDDGFWPDGPLAGPGGRLDLDAYETHALQFSASFVGANTVTPIGLKEAEAKFNYFVGDAANHREGVASYEIVAYEGLYAGIDLHTWGLRSSLKYEFIVAPGVDWSVIQVSYHGIAGLSLAEDGSLVVDLGEEWGSLTDDVPYIYQVINGEQVAVAGRFAILDKLTYSFEITGEYDPNLTLVIDPDMAWTTTYLGGNLDDSGYGIAVDSSGNALVTGITSSNDFPGANNDYKAGYDAFVAKVSSSGSLIWATYLGGSGFDWGYGIAVDGSGNALVAGKTDSNNFSGSNNAYKGGSDDAFVAKVSSSGSLMWATYLGGSGYDYGYGIAVDGSGNALVVGETNSNNFSGATNAYKGGDADAFVAKVSSAGSIIWVTYLGSSHFDFGRGIAVDGSGNALVTGRTDSSDVYGDVLIAKVSSAGSIIWERRLDGNSFDYGIGIAVDSAGNALVTGYTWSSNLSGANNAYKGGPDAFVAKVSSAGSLLWTTYLGGSDYSNIRDVGYGIAVDSSGNAVVTGYTEVPNFSGANNSYKGNKDAFVAKVSSSGSLMWATYLGGSSYDYGYGIAVDGSGNILVTGYTDSYDFLGAQNSQGMYNDAFVAKLSVPLAPSGLTASAVSSSQINLSWTDKSNNEAGFYIERKTGVSGTWSQIATVGANVKTYQSTGLAAGTQYYYRVRAYNAIGASGYSNTSDATTQPVAPVAPSGLAASAVSSSQINLSWTDKSNNEAGFYIERKTGVSGTWSQIATVGANVTTYQSTGLTAETPYYYRVRAYNAGGNSAYSNEANATTLVTAPAAPSGLSATTASSSQINLSWTDNANNETGFYIERKTGASGTWSQITAVGANVSTYQNVGLSEGTTYYYRVRAYNAGGDSAYSDDANTTTQLTAPAIPSGLTATAVSSSQINLSWTDKSNNEDGFYIERKIGLSGVWEEIAAVGADVTTYQNIGLASSTPYYYRVRATNAAGDSGHSNEASGATFPAGIQAVIQLDARGQAVYQDANGNQVTVQLTGGGTGMLYFANVVPADPDLLELTGTTAKSILTISTGRGVVTTIGDLNAADGGLNALKAATTILAGDLTIAGGVEQVILAGTTGEQSTILIGPAESARQAVKLQLGMVSNLGINSQTPIASITATEWRDTDAVPDLIAAPWLGTLKTTGTKGNAKLSIPAIPGDFAAGLTLTGEDAPKGITLNSATVLGDVAGSSWDITGNVGTIDIRGSVTGWSLGVHSAVKSLKLGDVVDAFVNVEGAIGAVQAIRWHTGSLTAASVGTLKTTGTKGNAKLSIPAIPGDFAAGLTLTGEDAPKGITLNTANIAGDLMAATWDIQAGLVGMLTFAGTVRDSIIRSAGSIKNLTMAASTGSDFAAGVPLDLIQADRHVAVGDVANSPQATIESFTVKGWKLAKGAAIPRFFLDSNISAGVGKLSVQNWDGLGGLFAPAGGVGRVQLGESDPPVLYDQADFVHII